MPAATSSAADSQQSLYMRLAPVEKDGGDILAQFTRMWKNTSKFCYSAKLRLFFPHYCAILGRTEAAPCSGKGSRAYYLREKQLHFLHFLHPERPRQTGERHPPGGKIRVRSSRHQSGASCRQSGASCCQSGASFLTSGASKISYGGSVGLNSLENSSPKSLRSYEGSLRTRILPPGGCRSPVWRGRSGCRKCRKCSNFFVEQYYCAA